MFSPTKNKTFCGIFTYIWQISQLYIFLTDCHLDKIMGKNRSQGQKWNLLQLCYASMMIRSVVWRKQRTWQRNVPWAHLLFILRLMFDVGSVYACFFHAYIHRLSDWIVIVLFFLIPVIVNTVEDERYHLQNERWLWWCLGSLLLSTGTTQIKYFAGCTHTHSTFECRIRIFTFLHRSSFTQTCWLTESLYIRLIWILECIQLT